MPGTDIGISVWNILATLLQFSYLFSLLPLVRVFLRAGGDVWVCDARVDICVCVDLAIVYC